jgi:cobalt/nickel transport system permease protein
MSNIVNSIYNIRFLDDLAQKDTSIHRIHPLIKLLTTVVYLTVVVSFGRWEIEMVLSFVFYPILIFAFAEIPLIPILKRLLIVEPFIIGIGILNPLFDKQSMIFFGLTFSSGWITFLSIFIKGSLTATASILLIATTGMDNLASALRIIKIPKIFVLQLLLTYRYISVLIEEVSRMMRAYSLRAPMQKGIHVGAWGSFAGQLLLRTFDRAQRVYEAMSLRGFTGEYHTGKIAKIPLADLSYLMVWSLFFIIARVYNIPNLIGSLVTGVIK